MNTAKPGRPARSIAAAALVAALCGTTLTACGTEKAGGTGTAAAPAKGIVCPDGSTPDTAASGGAGEDLTSDDIGGTGEDLTSDDIGGAGEDLTSDDIGGAGEDLTSDDIGGSGEDLTSDDIGGTGEDLTSDPAASDPAASGDGLPEGPSECWGPEYGKNGQSAPPRVNGVPTVGAHRWYGMKGEFTAYLKSTPSKTDDALAEGIRMVKIRLPEHSKIMEARIASSCGPFVEKCDAKAKAFADWRRAKYGDHGHVVLFGGAKTTVETTW